jgi:hypothetical protein
MLPQGRVDVTVYGHVPYDKVRELKEDVFEYLKHLDDYNILIYNRKKIYVRLNNLQEVFESASNRSLILIERNIKNLESAFFKTHPHNNQKFQWGDISPILIAGMVLDAGVGTILYKRHIVTPPEDYWIWVIMGGTEARYSFGLKVMHKEKFGVAKLWASMADKTKRGEFIAEDDFSLLMSLYRKKVKKEDIPSHLLKNLLKMKYMKIVGEKDESYYLTIPQFYRKDMNFLSKKVLKLSDLIVNEVYIPTLRTVKKMLPDNIFEIDSDIFKALLNKFLMEYTLDKLRKRRILPDLSRWFSSHSGFWIWEGNNWMVSVGLDKS